MRDVPDLDFVLHSEKHWTWVAAGLFLAAAALAASSYLAYRAEHKKADATLLEAQRQLAVSASPQSTKATNTHPVWLKDAETFIAEDWNVLFDRIERIDVPGVRLVSMQAGLHPRAVRVEFELDGWPRVFELNEAMNQPEGRTRWNLVSVASVGGGGIQSGGLRGIWQSM